MSFQTCISIQRRIPQNSSSSSSSCHSAGATQHHSLPEIMSCAQCEKNNQANKTPTPQPMTLQGLKLSLRGTSPQSRVLGRAAQMPVCSHWSGTHRVRGDNLKLCQGSFRLNIGENLFTKWAVQPGNPSVGEWAH